MTPATREEKPASQEGWRSLYPKAMVEYHTPTSPEKDVSPELLQKVRAIQIKTNHLANDIMTEEYESPANR